MRERILKRIEALKRERKEFWLEGSSELWATGRIISELEDLLYNDRLELETAALKDAAKG